MRSLMLVLAVFTIWRLFGKKRTHPIVYEGIPEYEVA
jgi:hypothetical protein